MDQKFDSTINDLTCDLPLALVEKEYLERFAFNWKKLIDNDFPPILDNFLASLDNKKKELNVGKETEDLGTTFNDMRLNMRVLSPTGGELDVFSSSIIDGVLQFKCEICSITVLGKRNIESHMLGKKHKAKLDDFKVVENSVGPRSKSNKSALAITDAGVLTSLLPLYKAAPLVGLQFVVEVLAGSAPPTYYCFLCKAELTLKELMFHLLSAEHRLSYLDKFFPTVRLKFAKVPNRRFWEIQTYEFLDSVVNRIECKFGRGKPFIVENSEMFEAEKSRMMAALDSGDHPRESAALNFVSLPDPFQKYISRIPRHQIMNY